MKAVLFLSAMIIGAGLAQAKPNFECKVNGNPYVVSLTYTVPVSESASQVMVYEIGRQAEGSVEKLLETCEIVTASIGDRLPDGETQVYCLGEKSGKFVTNNFELSPLGAAVLTSFADKPFATTLEFKPEGTQNGAEVTPAFTVGGNLKYDEDCAKTVK